MVYLCSVPVEAANQAHADGRKHQKSGSNSHPDLFPHVAQQSAVQAAHRLQETEGRTARELRTAGMRIIGTTDDGFLNVFVVCPHIPK